MNRSKGGSTAGTEFDEDLDGAASLATESPKYICTNGFLNGDIAAFFGMLAVVLPVLTALGAVVSFRMSGLEQREAADRTDGGSNSVQTPDISTCSLCYLLTNDPDYANFRLGGDLRELQRWC
eukprot:SAG31_NODE_21627_length_545_cov_0.690583_2_plen_123_part_00